MVSIDNHAHRPIYKKDLKLLIYVLTSLVSDDIAVKAELVSALIKALFIWEILDPGLTLAHPTDISVY